MTTYAHEDLKRILELHRKWYDGEEGGERANLDGANLVGANLDGANLVRANLVRANLVGANLDGANLVGANLDGANLVGAKISEATVLSDGVTWKQYLEEVVPALLVAGGKALADVATEEVWSCHAWSNCPMHAAFGADRLSQVPALYRWQAERFVQLFDANLIPLPVPPEVPTSV